MQLISWNGLNRMVDWQPIVFLVPTWLQDTIIEQFDINEETLHAAVDVLFRSVLKINAS